MKKFIAGVAVGALIFGAVPVFADSIKSLVGTKVTGVYTVEQDGKKIADGAVLNGSAYVPVRAIANATGTSLTVEGKKITLGSKTIQDDSNSKVNQMVTLESKKKDILEGIKGAEGGVQRYETDILPRAQKNHEDTIGTDTEGYYKGWLDDRTAEYNEYKDKLAQLQAELKEVEAQIETLK